MPQRSSTASAWKNVPSDLASKGYAFLSGEKNSKFAPGKPIGKYHFFRQLDCWVLGVSSCWKLTSQLVLHALFFGVFL